jgi:2-iminoacetate synthase
MGLLRSGKEGCFCKLNAVITFREWLDDFATEATITAGEKVIAEEIRQIKEKMPQVYPQFIKMYEKTAIGQRDLYF